MSPMTVTNKEPCKEAGSSDIEGTKLCEEESRNWSDAVMS